eukprot:6732663-Alexandrium_andersonii.AAC.1
MQVAEALNERALEYCAFLKRVHAVMLKVIMNSAGIDQVQHAVAQQRHVGRGEPTTKVHAPSYAETSQGTYRWRMAPLH